MESIEVTYLQYPNCKPDLRCACHITMKSPIWHYTISKNRGSEGLKKEKETTLVEHVKKMQAFPHLITFTQLQLKVIKIT